MLTLSQIDELTGSNDGSIYSDMYKDINGFRPRSHIFPSIEDFYKDFQYLANKVSEAIDEEVIRQAINWDKFVARVTETMDLVKGISRERAVEIIADSEGELDSYEFYGTERLEWLFNIKFGSIEQWIDQE